MQTEFSPPGDKGGHFLAGGGEVAPGIKKIPVVCKQGEHPVGRTAAQGRPRCAVPFGQVAHPDVSNILQLTSGIQVSDLIAGQGKDNSGGSHSGPQGRPICPVPFGDIAYCNTTGCGKVSTHIQIP